MLFGCFQRDFAQRSGFNLVNIQVQISVSCPMLSVFTSIAEVVASFSIVLRMRFVLARDATSDAAAATRPDQRKGCVNSCAVQPWANRSLFVECTPDPGQTQSPQPHAYFGNPWQVMEKTARDQQVAKRTRKMA